MSDYNWCHGPSCHKYRTQDRIRGVKGSKVLRTKKVKQDKWNTGQHMSMYSYFCSQGCYNDFANTYVREVIALHPRTEPLETPINDPVRTQNNYGWWHTEIKEIVDNNGG